MLWLCGGLGVEPSALGVLRCQPALSWASLWELQIKHFLAKPAALQCLSFLLAQPPALTHLFPTDASGKTHSLIQTTGEHTVHVYIHFQNCCLHHFLQLFRQSRQCSALWGGCLEGWTRHGVRVPRTRGYLWPFLAHKIHGLFLKNL